MTIPARAPASTLVWARSFLPGPADYGPDVLSAMASPVMSHRGPAFRALVHELQEGLRPLLRTTRPVYLVPSSGTGLMEAGVRNGVRRRVLCLVNGAFSTRFARIAAACGREVETYEVAPGEAHDPAEVRSRLRASGADAVTVVHSETSTGVLNPLAEIAEAVRSVPEVMLIVDGVSSVGGARVETDAWGLDWVCTASQKALALPPGLALGVASPALLERASGLPDRGVYFDLASYERHAEDLETPTTPPLPLLHALRARLERLLDEGIEACWDRHASMRGAVHRWIEERAPADVSFFAGEGVRSPTVSCLRLPDAADAGAVVDGLRREGWRIGGGYGPFRGSTIRIGHMGEHDVSTVRPLLEALDGVLHEALPPAGSS